EFAAERRDIPWARVSEERIERSVATLDPRKYNVRALECRSSRCIIEIQNNTDMHVPEENPMFFETHEFEGHLTVSNCALGIERSRKGEIYFIFAFEFRPRSMFNIVNGRLVELAHLRAR